MENSKATRERMAFAAISPIIESNIVLPTETAVRGHDYVAWGEANNYPEYLLDLFKNVPTLHSIISGSVDYVVGDDVIGNWNPWEGKAMNSRGESARELVKKCAYNYFLYGGFALQIIRNGLGEVAEIYVLNTRFLRANKNCDVFYYSEKWCDRYVRSEKMIIYPSWMAGEKQDNCILFVKNANEQVYPSPLYAASVKACEIEKSIDEYHLNEINNGFAPSVMINFNNGRPTDDIKKEIERSVQEKFAGKSNAGRIMLSWNESLANRTAIDQFSVQDYGAKYDALSAHSRQQIFTAFRANPNLFGIPTDNLGFSQEEYQQAFKLYNRTQIQPVQRLICDAFDKALGVEGSITIKPFTLERVGENNIQ